MTKHDFSNVSTGDTVRVSAFGGNLLSPGADYAERAESAFDGETEVFSTLASLGIKDAEQIVAISAQPEAREHLQSVLGINQKNFDSLQKLAENLLPKARLAQIAEPAPREFRCGVLPPTEQILEAAERSEAGEIFAEDRDFALAEAFPDSVNLIPFMPAIRNQAGRNTCVAFVLTALNEYVLRRHNILRDLSEQHLYYETKQIDGVINQCGTWQTKAVSALRNRGQTREEIWAYNPNLPCNNHGLLPPQARPDGMNHRLQTIAVPVRNVLAHKSNIASHRMVTLSFPVYNSWFNSAETRRSGRITMRIGSEPITDLHAVCLVGYQDDPTSAGGGFFIVRNSWGASWGSECPYGAGYGTIPYQYIANDAIEAFTAPVPAVGSKNVESNFEQLRSEEKVIIEFGSNIRITISSK